MEEDHKIPEIPEPEDTGSDGSQEASTRDLVGTNPQSALGEYALHETIVAYAEQKNYRGGETFTHFLVYINGYLSKEIEQANSKNTAASSDLQKLQSNLTNSLLENAVLKERLNADSNDRHLRHFAIAVGTLLLGLTPQLYQGHFDTTSIVLGISGVLLIIFGWWKRSKEIEK